MSATFRVGEATIVIKRGDITEEDSDAVVNAANSTLMGGGGVDGAIHRAGGPAILEECRRIIDRIGHCPTGEAVITTGGDLKAHHVIHTVGPVWRGGSHGEGGLLADAYRNSIRVAVDNGLSSLAFPSISTGAYRYPIRDASEVALRAVFAEVRGGALGEVRFVLFSPDDLAVYLEKSEEIGRAFRRESR